MSARELRKGGELCSRCRERPMHSRGLCKRCYMDDWHRAKERAQGTPFRQISAMFGVSKSQVMRICKEGA